MKDPLVKDNAIDETVNPIDVAIKHHLLCTFGYGGHTSESTDAKYLYRAAAAAMRDQLSAPWRETRKQFAETQNRRVHYISLEFLLGRSLNNAAQNIEMEPRLRQAISSMGLKLEEVVEQEHDAGLGNGGLGRLAACFLDSCANLALPVKGYGIRYEYGMFHQKIEDGRQVESPDHWLRNGNQWEIERPEYAKIIRLYGHIEHGTREDGSPVTRWMGGNELRAIPYDMPIPGFQNDTVNTLRLWKAGATDEFNLEEFNAGSYPEAVAAKTQAEQISMVLYPNDTSENGKELRLKQQYFLVSASLQDVLEQWVLQYGENFSDFGKLNCFQLNDTHPATAVPELMRLLMDEHGLQWDEAWEITSQCMAYTNHTLLPEALEKWSVGLFSNLLPRLAEIIFEINKRFLNDVEEKFPDDPDLLKRVSLIEGDHDQHFRMAFLSIVGSFSINGVAALHSDLLKSGLFADFYKIWPERFNNKTNGVTQRRWLSHCNPGLRELLGETIGTEWESDLEKISALKPMADDAEFRKKWREVKQANKERLSDYVLANTGVKLPTNSLFDVQVKRIHEYKRQLLNVLHVIHLYDRILRGDTEGMVPRSVLIGGKAAPGYFLAKQIIKLINDVAKVVNNEPKAEGLLKLVFFPNYRVSAMEIICPGTELSEQISTAGKEASGTGNMKFMMNGALTIGTLDGANIEIREQAGAENFFLFGLDETEVVETKKDYNPNDIIAADEDIQGVMTMLESGLFCKEEPGIFNVLTAGLRNPQDQWVTIADLRSYIDAQQKVAECYCDQERWDRMSIINSASSGWFSSDRTIQQYADEIWNVKPMVGQLAGK